jgi:elongation factor P--beta-lysine ligase
MNNPFEQHGIQHLSPSQINLFCSAPALWVMEKLLKIRSPVGAAAHRGTAAEDGIIAGLMEPEKPVDECIEIAQRRFRELTALSRDPNRAKESEAIAGIVKQGLAELRPYGVPTSTQGKIEYRAEGIAVPIIGFYDAAWNHHGIMTDIKTQLRLNSQIKTPHARQVSLYKAAISDNIDARVTPELYLKRLIVGGFEKVYEIARCFRNEGIDHNHNPEFTQIEYYWAYADYQDSMKLVEEMLPHLIAKVGLPLKFKTEDGEVNFTPPYPRKTMRALIQEFAKMDIEDFPDQDSIYKKAKELGVEIESFDGRGKIIDEIYKKFARPNIINPIFVTDHPVELSPLAKRKADDPRYTERFQLLCVGGNELCNAFSELNDPLDQEERFKEQERLVEAGDEEGMRYDEDYITALKHGMPPTSGLGMGIDRLVKLLVNAPNLKEVILFPTLRSER